MLHALSIFAWQEVKVKVGFHTTHYKTNYYCCKKGFSDLCNFKETTKQVIQTDCAGKEKSTLDKISLKEGEKILNLYLEHEIT